MNLDRAPIKVSSSAAHGYTLMRDDLIRFVDQKMLENENLAMLIGDNTLSVMHDNHINHADFMSAYFKINQEFLMIKTVKWVLASYESRGFSPMYFTVVLPIWQQAANHFLTAAEAKEINQIYDWMLAIIPKLHEEMENDDEILEIEDEQGEAWSDKRQLLLSYLLAGDPKSALKMINDLTVSDIELEAVYTRLIMPALYDVGKLWEQGQITIAHEHLATSIIIRVMSSLYSYFCSAEHSRGTAIVTSAVNEQHEIGARMVADVMELNGWNVFYLGANTPLKDVIKMIEEENPHILALSVTMSYNLPAAAELSEIVRANSKMTGMKIILGGYALEYFKSSQMQESLSSIDLISSSLEDTIQSANKWWDNGQMQKNFSHHEEVANG